MNKKTLSSIVLSLLLWLAAPANASATGQDGEILYWNGKEYEMLSLPLKYNDELDRLVAQVADFTVTSNWRGYQGHWSIQDNQLYLDSIVISYQKVLIPQKDSIFSKYLKDGKVPATWVSDTLRVVSGKCIKYEHMGFARYYEHEDFIAFKDGVVQSVRREEQKCLIKWDERTAVPKIHQFIEELSAQLHARYPKTHGYIGVSILYSDFDSNMMPTNVEATISKNTLTHPNPKLERELCEKVSNFVLINRIFPLYYIKGKITQDGRFFPFQIP